MNEKKELTAEESLKAKEKFDLATVAVRKFIKLMYLYSVTGVDPKFQEEVLYINEIPVDPSNIKKVFLSSFEMLQQASLTIVGHLAKLENLGVPEQVNNTLNDLLGREWCVGAANVFFDLRKSLFSKDGIPCAKFYSFAAYDISTAINIVERDKLPLIKASCLIAHDAYDPFVEHGLPISQ